MAPHKPLDSAHVLRMAQEALEIEARAVQQQAQRLGAAFVTVVQVVLHTPGRVVVMGMGKSGHVGRKIAAKIGRAHV